jgi:uncharacterized protein YdaU (DUF1376 family)
MKRAWMPLYVGDYLGDTGHLSTTQHGAYLLLMMHYWRKGELPEDDKQLAAITKLPLRVWQDSRETLQAFFYEGWKHKRIDTELMRMEKVSAKRAEAGFKGGIRSAMGRMRLEDAAGRPSNSQPIGKQLLQATKPETASNCSNFAQAELDHSHSQSKISSSTVNEDTAKGLGEGNLLKRPDQTSKAELEALFSRRRIGA